MKLYNTLSRQKQDFTPLNTPAVTVYTCGPTVYDYPHVGNWFTFIRYDILIRTLLLSGYEPNWVMNITDVGHLVSDGDEGEDKLEKGAKREGSNAWTIAQTYTDYFLEGLTRLNFIKPNATPKATDHIAEQIELIKTLEAGDYTYQIDDGVYFDSSKFKQYADFAKLDLDEQQSGARVEHNPQKKSPTDFALWKLSPKDSGRDMEWDSPWGKGFPGWHIECSAMIRKYLGDTIDIHSGGIDHIPVHHTNEVAQSQSATGKPLARFWMHSNHITINGEKIAKSASNGITLEDVEATDSSLQALRLHVLESHYRSQSKFSWDSLTAAQNRLKSYQALADLRFQELPGEATKNYVALLTQELPEAITKALQNDLDTPQVLYLLSVAEQDILEGYRSDAKQLLTDFFDKYIDQALGLWLLKSSDITADQRQLIEGREHARIAKDWNKADKLRDQLAKQGLGLRDTDQGAVWHRL